MKLIEKTYQDRRDFDGVYECQGCGAVEKVEGCYDDDYYHNNVIPEMKCVKCGKSTNDLGVQTNEWQQSMHPMKLCNQEELKVLESK